MNLRNQYCPVCPHDLASATDRASTRILYIGGLPEHLLLPLQSLRRIVLAAATSLALSSAHGQGPGSVDPTFDPTQGGELVGFAGEPGEVFAVETQNDGRLLLGGSFVGCNGSPRRNAARLNPDGSLDTGFALGTAIDGRVLAMAVQPDGKAVLGGEFTLMNSRAPFSLARFELNGAVDSGFVADVKIQAEQGSIQTLAVQNDGKILVGGRFDRINGVISFNLARLNTDGSVDRSFSSGALFRESGAVRALATLNGGKVLVGGFLGNEAVICRLNADGTPDPTFTNQLGGWYVRALGARNDRKIYAAGQIRVQGGGWPEEALVLLNEDGSIVQDFSVVKTEITSLQVQPDDRVVISGWFRSIRDIPRPRVARLNPDGTLDESFDPADTLGECDVSQLCLAKLATDGAVWLTGHFELPGGTSTALVRLRSDGRLDEVFHSQAPALQIAGPPGPIRATALLPGGEVIAGGSFSSVNNQARANLARLLPSGLLDTNFQAQWANGLEVTVLVRQADGKFLVGGNGSFIDANGGRRQGLIRLNDAGGLDLDFNSPWSDSWYLRLHCLALQSDNKILAGGEFENGLVRLNSDGSLDPTFHPPILPAYDGDAVYAAVVQPDGKIIVGGSQVIGLFRLNSDGSPDPSFRCDPALTASIHALALQPDGLVLVGGWIYSSSCEEPSRNLVRVRSDGTLDRGFRADIEVDPQSILPLADGRILVAGTADYPNRNAQIYCLFPDGAQDTDFSANVGVKPGLPSVHALSLQADSRVIIGGTFSTVNGQSVEGIARLHNQFLMQPPSLYAGPMSLTRFTGQTAEFTVQCAGMPPLVYQWSFNGSPIPGMTNRTLALDHLKQQHAGRYSVIVSNSVGVAVSDAATLTVLPIPSGPGSVDITFDPTRGGRLLPMSGTWTGDSWEHAVRTLVFQPDGRVVIGGSFSGIDNMPRNNVAGLTASGRLDVTFDTSWGADGDVNHITRQPDGKLILAGSFITVQGARRPALARLNADGTLDEAFDVGLQSVDPQFVVWRTCVQQDGKILVFGSFDHVKGVPRYKLARLNPNGSLDPDFNADPITSMPLTHIDALELLHDGRLLLGGGLPAAAQHIVRLSPDGTLDPAFVPSFSDAPVYALAEQSDGRIMASSSLHGVVRLNPDGSADPSFTPAQVDAGCWVNKLGILWDGRVLLGGWFNRVNGVLGFDSLALLNSDGSLDTTLDLPLLMEGTRSDTFFMLPDSRAVIVAEDDELADYRNFFYVLEPPNTFRLFFTNTFSARNGVIYQILPEPNGGVVISGPLTRWNEVRCPGYARLLADGTLDSHFYPTFGPMTSVQCHALDVDGRILITAAFPVQEEQFFERHAIGRLNPDASLDYTFGGGMIDIEETIATPNTVVLQPDGKILVGGYPYQILPELRPGVARFQPDGSVDPSFHPTPLPMGDDYGILALGLQSDGKIVLGGELTPSRYLPNGDLDASFQATNIWGVLFHVIVQPDDRLLIAGWFTFNEAEPILHLARLQANGSLDTTFNPPQSHVQAIARQPDGRVLVAYENHVIPLNPDDPLDPCVLVRLNSDGSIDPGFPWVKVNAPVHKITLQTDGRILLGGEFTAVNGIPCHGLARLNNVVLPVLRLVASPAGQPFRLELTGTPGPYCIEVSADLLNWALVGSVTNGPDGRCEFIVPSDNEPHRFYRARMTLGETNAPTLGEGRNPEALSAPGRKAKTRQTLRDAVGRGLR